MNTDASDYGIGGYLYQVVDGREVPVAFLSKSLSEAETRWSVTEKECYAFVYFFKKYEYLLRDRHFVLRTDHRNLTYINESASPKVRRWKILISEFDFDIEYIKGDDNFVADATSRLVGDARSVTSEEHTLSAISERNPKDSRVTHNARKCERTFHWDLAEVLASMVEIECPTLREELNANWEEVKIPSDKYKIISAHHNSHVGHHGVERTLAKLLAPSDTENNFRPVPEPWPHMREQVAKFIKNCPCCQKMTRLRNPIHTRGFTTASEAPMARVSIDTIGPLPADAEGMSTSS